MFHLQTNIIPFHSIAARSLWFDEVHSQTFVNSSLCFKSASCVQHESWLETLRTIWQCVQPEELEASHTINFGNFIATRDDLKINDPGIILCVCPANERWRYTVTPSLIGWAHTQNDPWNHTKTFAKVCASQQNSYSLFLQAAVPFAVVGSTTVIEIRGRKVRGRMYPWGVVEVENPDHCDFIKLRTMLM